MWNCSLPGSHDPVRQSHMQKKKKKKYQVNSRETVKGFLEMNPPFSF